MAKTSFGALIARAQDALIYTDGHLHITTLHIGDDEVKAVLEHVCRVYTCGKDARRALLKKITKPVGGKPTLDTLRSLGLAYRTLDRLSSSASASALTLRTTRVDADAPLSVISQHCNENELWTEDSVTPEGSLVLGLPLQDLVHKFVTEWIVMNRVVDPLVNLWSHVDEGDDPKIALTNWLQELPHGFDQLLLCAYMHFTGLQPTDVYTSGYVSDMHGLTIDLLSLTEGDSMSGDVRRTLLKHITACTQANMTLSDYVRFVTSTLAFALTTSGTPVTMSELCNLANRPVDVPVPAPVPADKVQHKAKKKYTKWFKRSVLPAHAGPYQVKTAAGKVYFSVFDAEAGAWAKTSAWTHWRALSEKATDNSALQAA